MRVSDQQARYQMGESALYDAMAEDLLDARALLREYMEWEADVILNADWSGPTARLTQEQHDWLTEIAIKRNRALGYYDEKGEQGIREHLGATMAEKPHCTGCQKPRGTITTHQLGTVEHPEGNDASHDT